MDSPCQPFQRKNNLLFICIGAIYIRRHIARGGRLEYHVSRISLFLFNNKNPFKWVHIYVCIRVYA